VAKRLIGNGFVLDGRSDGSRDEAALVCLIHERGYLGANVGRPIATNGEFAVSRNISKSLWDLLCACPMHCGKTAKIDTLFNYVSKSTLMSSSGLISGCRR